MVVNKQSGYFLFVPVAIHSGREWDQFGQVPLSRTPPSCFHLLLRIYFMFFCWFSKGVYQDWTIFSNKTNARGLSQMEAWCRTPPLRLGLGAADGVLGRRRQLGGLWVLLPSGRLPAARRKHQNFGRAP